MRNLFVAIIGLLLSSGVTAQNEGNWWFFGSFAGLHFTPTGPVPTTVGGVNTMEGCATQSDAAGNLLFYTEGMFVYNRLHAVMPNGNSLMGNSSSTQSAIIVPRPGSNTEFYVFTVSQECSASGLRYSMVDMSLQSGLGDVTLKNVPLFSPVTERITTVLHSNGTDIWLIAQKCNAQEFMAYQITPTGINPTPVISVGGTNPLGTTNRAIGYMKSSPMGDKIGIAYEGPISAAELYAFNANTGQLSNPIVIPKSAVGNYRMYGTEFSPDGTRWYLSGYSNPPELGHLYQIDLTQPNDSAIVASLTRIAESNSTYTSSLQLGPDGKIYVSRLMEPHLGRIENPNALGTACNFVDTAVAIGTSTSTKIRLGLPNFMPSLFVTFTMQTSGACANAPWQFNVSPANYADSIRWVVQGEIDTFSMHPLTFTFDSAGIYGIKALVYRSGRVTTIQQNVVVTANPTVELGDTLLFCGQKITLDVQQSGSQFVWNDGNTSGVRTIQESGLYWVQVTDTQGCTGSDSLLIKPCGCQVHIPNSFTPNQDGLNDIFRPHSCEIRNLEMHIFNRWGQPVYSSSKATEGWDGRTHGQLNPQGIYVYTMRYLRVEKDGTLVPEEQRGKVVLIR